VSDDEVIQRTREWIAENRARPRQEFVAAVLVIVGLAITVGLFLVFR
jgi:hypothetical protein